MPNEIPDRFVLSLKPLFRERTIYRLLTAAGLVLTLLGNNFWLFVPGIILLVAAGLKLAFVGTNLETQVWNRFSAQLDPVNVTRHTNPQEPLRGVIGSIGDFRHLSVLAQGRYGPYDIRLLRQTVSYNPQSKNGSYSRRYRVLEITTRQEFYHVFLDSKSNDQSLFSTSMNILSRSVRDNQILTVEGDVHKHFQIYVPADDAFKSLVTLTPEKLLALRDYGSTFDVEFIDNRIYLITNDKIKNAKDILVYRASALAVLEHIGMDLVRTRRDINNSLTVTTPTVLTF